MDWYISWVKENMLLSSFVQFALLGTLGEILGIKVSNKKISLSSIEWPLKALAWGILGIIIKYAFVGVTAAVQGITEHFLLPPIFIDNIFINALTVSTVLNLFFGPQMMYMHRWSDNFITKSQGYSGIEKSLLTLLWFWIPAHTVTFTLPSELRIGLAAVWSVALGIIMGYFKRCKSYFEDVRKR